MAPSQRENGFWRRIAAALGCIPVYVPGATADHFDDVRGEGDKARRQQDRPSTRLSASRMSMQASLRASSGPRRSTDSATSAHSPHYPRQQQRPHPHPQPLSQRTSPTHAYPHGGTPASPLSGHSNGHAHGHAQPNSSASGHHLASAQHSLARGPSANAGHTSRHSPAHGKGSSPGSGTAVRRSRSRGAGSGSDPLDEYAADCESDSEPTPSPRVSGRRSAAASPRSSRPSRQRPSARERDRVAALQQQEQQHAAAGGSVDRGGDRAGDRGGAGSDVDSPWVGPGQGGVARYASDHCISDAEPASPALADGSYSPGLNVYGSGGGGGGGAGRWRSGEGVSPRGPPAHSAASPLGDSPASPFGAHAHPQPYARTRLASASSTPRGLAHSPHDPGPGLGHAIGLSSREGSVTMSPGAALGGAAGAGPQLFHPPTSRLQHVGSAHGPPPGWGAPGGGGAPASPGGRPMGLPPQFAGLQVAVDSPCGSAGGAGAGYSPRGHGHGQHGALHGHSPLGLAVAREGSVVLASPRGADGYVPQGSGVLVRVGSVAGGSGGTPGGHVEAVSRQGSFAGHPGTPRGGGASGAVSHGEVMSPKRTGSVTAAGGVPLMSSVMLASRTTKQQQQQHGSPKVQQHVGQGRGAGGNSGAFVGEVVVARVGSITGRVGSVSGRLGSITGRVGSMTATGLGPGVGMGR